MDFLLLLYRFLLNLNYLELTVEPMLLFPMNFEGSWKHKNNQSFFNWMKLHLHQCPKHRNVWLNNIDFWNHKNRFHYHWRMPFWIQYKYFHGFLVKVFVAWYILKIRKIVYIGIPFLINRHSGRQTQVPDQFPDCSFNLEKLRSSWEYSIELVPREPDFH